MDVQNISFFTVWLGKKWQRLCQPEWHLVPANNATGVLAGGGGAGLMSSESLRRSGNLDFELKYVI